MFELGKLESNSLFVFLDQEQDWETTEESFFDISYESFGLKSYNHS